MSFTLKGPMRPDLSIDDEGYREYKIPYLVVGSSTNDGPRGAALCPGLPLPGSFWALGNDIDPWVWCRANVSVQPHIIKDEKGKHFIVTKTFSNKPMGPGRSKCQDQQIESPLLEPPKISGGSQKTKEEATHDRFGYMIVNSAWEQMRGPQVEFDTATTTIKVEMNVPTLNLALLDAMLNTVNIFPIWGKPRRCVKFSSYTFDRQFYGQCYVYYKLNLEFESNPNTWDRILLDEGTKVLNGHWNPQGNWQLDDIDGGPPDYLNPRHFIRFKDRRGENARVVLNGFGEPMGTKHNAGGPFVYIEANNTLAAPPSANWIRQIGGLFAADLNRSYVTGNVVVNEEEHVENFWELRYYIAKQNISSIGDHPFPALEDAFWKFLPTGLRRRGVFDINATYTVGDFVFVPDTEEPAGSIAVEKYLESNFLVLGVPPVF